ncbi:hypothetical protein Droror1_Dr00001128 [Drosera rotundifolia]
MEGPSNLLATTTANPTTLPISDTTQTLSTPPLHHSQQHHTDDLSQRVQETEPDSEMKTKEEEETGLDSLMIKPPIVSAVKESQVEEGLESLGDVGMKENGGFEVGFQKGGCCGSDSLMGVQEMGVFEVGFRGGGCGCDSLMGMKGNEVLDVGFQKVGGCGSDSKMGTQESGEVGLGIQEGSSGSDSSMVMQESGEVELGFREGGSSGFGSSMMMQESGIVESGFEVGNSGSYSSMDVQETGDSEVGFQVGGCRTRCDSSMVMQENGGFELGLQEGGSGSSHSSLGMQESGKINLGFQKRSSRSDSSMGVQETVEFKFRQGSSGSDSSLGVPEIQNLELGCSQFGFENVGFENGCSVLEVLGGEIDVGLTTSGGDGGGVLVGGELEKRVGDDVVGMICGVIRESDEYNVAKRSVVGGPSICSIKLEMVDGMAVIDVSKVMEDGKENVGGVDGRKRNEAGRKLAKRAKHVKGKGLDGNGVNHGVWRERGKKITYTREDLEKLRYVNAREQRKVWYEIYNGLTELVRKEYDEVGSFRFQKPHGNQGFDNCQATGRRNNFNGILETINPVDNVCDDNDGDDGDYAMDEFNEDESTDDEYECIKRPAFLVEGEPNFDSGPPEDGLEYLRRVRWEASQIPNVKVAKLENKPKKEQTIYMPQIPDIEKCPEHLAPTKQWEDEFLADFSNLRLGLSQLETPCVAETSELCLVLKPEKVPSVKAVVREVDVGHNEEPILSKVLGMDLATRVKMLMRRIALIEEATNLSRNDCLWLFAFCATVDIPLDADTAAALRGLLRKCAKLLASKSKLDDEAVMLNILATITGKFFGQSEC